MRKVLIRNLDEETYMKLYWLRKKFRARNWAELIKMICEEYEEAERWP